MGKSKEIAELAGHFNVSSTEAVTAADLTVTGDLTVNGTNTTINSATLTVDDKNIVVAQGSADAAAADGAGLTVDGASATLTYASTGDKFVFNKQVDSTVIRATSATDVSLSSTGHGFQVGADNTLNIAMDGNEIQARNNGGTSPLYLNAEGGTVYFGPNTAPTISVTSGDLTMYGVDTGQANFDPVINLQRSPSDNSVSNWDYLGALYFNGKDSANNNTSYSVWSGRIEDSANGSETGRIENWGLKSGTWGQQYVLSPYNFILSNGQQIQWKDWSSTYEMNLKPTDTITAERTIKLPDEDGTVVLAETVTNFLSDISVTSGTDAKVTINDAIGEVGAGNIAFQAVNSAGSALKPMGFRAEDIRFATGSAERMRIDDSGRIGIGVTPNSNISASTFPGNISLGEQGVLLGNATSTQIGHNFYWNGSAFKYLGSGKASRIYQQSGEIVFQTTDDNGATDNNLTTLNSRMKIDSVGNVDVAPNSTSNYLRVNSNARTNVGLNVGGSSTTSIGMYLDNSSGSSTLDIAALGSNYNAHGAGAGDIWFYSPDNINIGGATGSTNEVRILGSGGIRHYFHNTGYIGNPTAGGSYNFKGNGGNQLSIKTSQYTAGAGTNIAQANVQIVNSAFGALVFIAGYNAPGYPGAQFCDLVYFGYNASPTILAQQTIAGSPPNRTYTGSGYALYLSYSSNVLTTKVNWIESHS